MVEPTSLAGKGREGDVWGGTLDGSDVSVSWMQRTLTNASTTQLQVPSPPLGSVLPSKTSACTSLTGWLNTPVMLPPPRQAAPFPPLIYPHSQSSANRATSPPMAPALSRTPVFTPIRSHMRFGVTPTPQPQPTSTSTGSAPLTPNLPFSISKPNYVVIPSSSVSLTHPYPLFLFHLLSNPWTISHLPSLGQHHDR